MGDTMVGQRAPSFRLPSAQGPEAGPEDYRGRNLILFFAKGMACGFCRQKMTQLSRGLPRFRELGAEILQIAPTPLDRGRFYARNFQLPFPYLCDPEYRAYAVYGIGRRKTSLVARAKAFYAGMTMPEPANDWPSVKPSLKELSRVVEDDDLGFFVVDRGGMIRYATTGSYVIVEGGKFVGMRPIPSNEEIARELERCEGVAA
ncbi:MAG TPA: redoxin domain-containing protein [Candidatus Tectomicrobia bacterium]|nr:redoxin domain-containing protein [Candidatus Tectomicrobia bacterium]